MVSYSSSRAESTHTRQSKSFIAIFQVKAAHAGSLDLFRSLQYQKRIHDLSGYVIIFKEAGVMVEIAEKVLLRLNIFLLQSGTRRFQIEERQETATSMPPYRIVLDYIDFLVMINSGFRFRVSKLFVTSKVFIH